MGDVLDDIAGWFASVGEEFGRVSLGLLVLALALQTAQTALNAVAWRSILRAAYPAARVPFGPVFGAYAGGLGLNQLLPAQAGTIATLGLYRGMVAGATVPGLAGAQFVQSLFFAAMGLTVYVILLVTRPGAGDLQFGALLDHIWLTGLIAAAVIAVVAVLGHLVRHRLQTALRDAREGAAILGAPRRYLGGVLLPQASSYAMRVAVMAVLMSAYGVPVSPRNIFLVIASTSLANLVALTPGGVGTEQALMLVTLRDAAPSATVAAFSIGQHVLLAAWNVALGIVALTLTIGGRETRALIHDQWAEAHAKKAREAEGAGGS